MVSTTYCIILIHKVYHITLLAQLNKYMSLLQPPGLGAVQNQPVNINFLATHRFRVALWRSPSVEYFVQECNLPGMGMGTASQPTPFTDIPHPGDKIQFEDFTMVFPVDEDMRNYKEIATWILANGFPRDYGQFAEIRNAKLIKSNISVIVLGAQQEPVHSIVIYDAFPVSISGIQFDTKVSDTMIPLCSATFKYTFFQIDEDTNNPSGIPTPADH